MKFPTLIALIPCITLPGCMPAGSYPGGGQSVAISQTVGRRAAPPAAPKLRRLENGHYRVTKPWTVILGGREWHVQKGYTSNGITGPSAIRKRMGDGVEFKETWAAVFHDWLFTQPGITRTQADRMFKDLLLAYGVPAQKADMMYNTVALYSLTKSIR